jgi:hypothetical protein
MQAVQFSKENHSVGEFTIVETHPTLKQYSSYPENQKMKHHPITNGSQEYRLVNLKRTKSIEDKLLNRITLIANEIDQHRIIELNQEIKSH